MTQLAQTIILGLLIGGVYALLASGLTLIFGVMDVVNVAQGALIILSAFLTWALWMDGGPATSATPRTTPPSSGRS
mgnify:CR=1 FL=1